MTRHDHPRIGTDPEICGGRPTVRGTRMPVADVLEMLANGATDSRIVADFPYLTRDDIRACLAFAASLADQAGRAAAPGPIAPGSYTLETLPPPGEGAAAILASVDATARRKRAVAERAAPDAAAAPRVSLEDEGAPGIDLSDEGLPGLDPDR